MRHRTHGLGATLLLAALAACGDDGGAAVDASIDGAPPPPTCDGDAGVASDDTATTPGAATAPHPTLRNLTVEWAITTPGPPRITIGWPGAPSRRSVNVG